MSLNLDKSTWKRVAFGDVVRNLNVTVKDPSAEGIDQVVAMEHLDPGELKISRCGSIEDGTTFTRRVKPGQTLFGKRRAYQRKAAYAEFDAITSGDILVFEADPTQLLPEFLPFLVQSDGFYDHALDTSAGSLSPRTNWRDLSNYEFELPPLDEQQRLADLLWAIERHHVTLSDLRARIAGQRLAAVDRYVTAALDAKQVRLDAVAEVRSGIAKGKKVGGESIERPYLRVANVQAGSLNLAEIKTIAISAIDAKKYELRNGDVLMTEGGDIDKLGRGTVWREQIKDCLHQNHVFAVRVDRSKVLPEWISLHTEATSGREFFVLQRSVLVTWHQ